jgi:DNA/RNA endonuclease YhcR with UshA esterase domain
VSPAEASSYIGQKATVCGTVASATFASRTKGQPTFLNLDEPYPRQIFTIVIWGSDRRFFNNAPEVLYRGKKVCVTGLVKSFRGKPEITVLLPSQIAQQ